MEDINQFFSSLSYGLLAIQDILQNSNIFIESRETVLFTPIGNKTVAQFSGLPPPSAAFRRLKAMLTLYRINFRSCSETDLIQCEQCLGNSNLTRLAWS